MLCDEKKFLRGIEFAIEEIGGRSDTGNRIRDFLQHSLNQSKTIEGFKAAMLKEINGSSSHMLAHFIYDVIHFVEIGPSIESGIKSAHDALVDRYGETPKPNGLIYAFRTFAIANESSLTPIDAARKTADILIDLDVRDNGTRAFALGLKGFVKAFD